MVSQIVLFSQPRSGSHLLERMLTRDQLDIQVLSHPFSASRGKQVPWLLRGDYAEGMKEDESREYEQQIQKEVGVWEKALDEAQFNNHPLFIHSHPFFPVSPSAILSHLNTVLTCSPNPSILPNSNFTLVPNNLLLRPGTTPLISIRNPRLAVPSTMRVLDRMNLPHGGSRPFLLETTCNIWNVLLYRFYTSHGIQPVVIDAEDFTTSEEFVTKLCVRVGLDPERAVFRWDAVTGKQREEEIRPMLYASQNTLFESEGVVAGKAVREGNAVVEETKWEEEFGEDVGLVREMDQLAEPFYRWLYERRWKGDV